MNFFRLIILALISFIIFGQTTEINPKINVFKIIENDKIGYIDSTGRVVIKPIFLSGDNFSEGVANVRLNGTYGYIDKTGEFVIPPQFDYAEPFEDSIAKVYLDGIPCFINHKGERLFENKFPGIQITNNNRFIVTTSSDKKGCVDRQGKLIVDTTYSEISGFNEGLAVVKGFNHYPYCDHPKILVVGIIDTNGKFIVPFGICKKIEDYSNGYYIAEFDNICEDDLINSNIGIIDCKGKILFNNKVSSKIHLDYTVNCGLAKINLYKYWIPEPKGNFTTEKSYEGYLNTNGEIVLNDTNVKQALDFSCNRSYIRNKNFIGKIIDTKMNTVLDSVYCDNNFSFKNGMAFVEKGGKWGLIDTNGIFLIEPKFDIVDNQGITNNYFFFKEGNKSGNYYNGLTGICRIDGKIILEPSIKDFNGGWFHNGLFTCYSNDKLIYYNSNGKVIWQQKDCIFNSLKNINIDFMKEGYFFALSKPKSNDIGGFTPSNNLSEIITISDSIPPNLFYLTAKPNKKDTFSFSKFTFAGLERNYFIDSSCNRYNGYRIYLANTTAKEIQFDAIDCRLNMIMQALNKDGEWKDIEYIYGTDVMNSYHTLTLEPNRYWSFVSPVYEGDFKTKLRIAVQYIDPDDKTEQYWMKRRLTLYSNEFDGSINPAQLWRREYFYF